MDFLNKKLELEEKKEDRKLKELDERRKEREENMRLIRDAMFRNNLNPQ